MKTINHFLNCLILLFLLSCNSSNNEINWKEGPTKSKAIEKDLVLIRFYGDNCVPCKRLEKETLSQKNVIALISKNFDCYKVNTWKKENSNIRLENIYFL